MNPLNDPAPKTKVGVNILLVIAGILIPIIAALIPYIIDMSRSVSDLEYDVEGPIEVADNYAFVITIENTGWEVEKGIEIWLPRKFSSSEAVIDTPVEYKLRNESNNTVVIIGDIRPEETLKVGFLIRKSSFFFISYEVDKLKIISESHMAHFGGTSEGWKLIQRIGFWGFFVLLGFLLLMGIYEIFMPKKMREKLIMDHMDKL